MSTIRDARDLPDWVRVDQLVKLTRGWTGMKVMDVEADREHGFIIHACYTQPNYDKAKADKSRPWHNFEPYSGDNHHWADKEGSCIMATKKLYAWKDEAGKEKYGHRLAINSAGLWVMDELGKDASVHVVDRKLVEAVIPHSVTVTFINDHSSRKYDYWAPKDVLEVGSMVLMNDGQFVRVVELDTKSEKAGKHLEGTIIQGTVLKGEEDDELSV